MAKHTSATSRTPQRESLLPPSTFAAPPVLPLTVVSSPVVPAPVASPPRERFFLVKQTAHVPRLGTHFVLPAGKVISSGGYDIAGLEALGVPLEEVTEGVTPRRARLV